MGAAERPDLLELAQGGHVGAKSMSDEDDYLAGAGGDVGVVAVVGVAAKVSTSDGVGRLSSEMLALCEATSRLSQFAEFYHDSENISPVEATIASVVRFVEQAELIVSDPTLEYRYNFRALVASVVDFMFFAKGLTGVSCRVRDVHVDDHNIIMQVLLEKGRAGRRGPDDLRVMLLPGLRKGAASAANAIGVPLSHIRYQGGWATNSDVALDYIDPSVLLSPGARFFFGHIAPLRHFQVQQDSAAVALSVPLS
eukprot:jgi/Tetstr1/433029/TSEL_022366.t1